MNLYVQGNQAGAPQLNLSSNTISFGSVTVGQTANQTFIVSNPGSATLTVGSITASAGFSVVSPLTPFTVAAGGSQLVTVRFAPASAGAVSGSLSIANNAGAAASVSLSGTGVAAGAPAIGVSAISLSFGSVTTGHTANMTFTVNNTGTASLTINSITVASASGFSVVSPSTPFNVAAGASHHGRAITFAPTAATSYSSTLTIASTDPNKPSVTVSLSGAGAAAVPLACGFTLSAGIYAKWTALGGSSGVLGCPTANEKAAAASPQGSTGTTAPFANGAIYLHSSGTFAGQAYEMHSCTPTAYTNLGSSAGAFGFPVSDQYAVDQGFRNDFQGGYIIGPTFGVTCLGFPASLDFSGVWSTDRGLLAMLQNSFDVTGTYTTPSGSITSFTPVANSAFAFSWQDSSGQGTGNFTLASDGNSFTGTYAKTGLLATSQWNGTRTSTGSVGWLTPLNLNFGTVAVNSSSTLNVVAQAPVLPLTLQTFNSSNAAFQVSIGSTQVLPGGQTLIPIRFTPRASGSVSGTITIGTLDAARPQVTIQVAGTGQ